MGGGPLGPAKTARPGIAPQRRPKHPHFTGPLSPSHANGKTGTQTTGKTGPTGKTGDTTESVALGLSNPLFPNPLGVAFPHLHRTLFPFATPVFPPPFARTVGVSPSAWTGTRSIPTPPNPHPCSLPHSPEWVELPLQCLPSVLRDERPVSHARVVTHPSHPSFSQPSHRVRKLQ